MSRVMLTLLETCYVVQGGRGNCYRQVIIMTLIMTLCNVTGGHSKRQVMLSSGDGHIARDMN